MPVAVAVTTPDIVVGCDPVIKLSVSDGTRVDWVTTILKLSSSVAMVGSGKELSDDITVTPMPLAYDDVEVANCWVTLDTAVG